MGTPASGGRVWAVIPARGGSKSIPLKNLALLAGKPLLEYVIAAARGSGRVERIICSTDHEGIASLCRTHNVEVHRRPADLSGDSVPVLEVLVHLLRDMELNRRELADVVCLLQPTSPFALPEDIDAAVAMLQMDRLADSVQTVALPPHNFHAYNQRVIEGETVRFRFPEERRIGYNKQTKPVHYIFGNLVVTRGSTLLQKSDIFGRRSLPRIIPLAYAADIDGPEDLEYAEWLLASGKVRAAGEFRSASLPRPS